MQIVGLGGRETSHVDDSNGILETAGAHVKLRVLPSDALTIACPGSQAA
jgi:hypothetical protein